MFVIYSFLLVVCGFSIRKIRQQITSYLVSLSEKRLIALKSFYVRRNYLLIFHIFSQDVCSLAKVLSKIIQKQYLAT